MFIRLHYWLMGFIAITLLTTAAGYYYLSQSHRSIEKQFTDTLDYNIYQRGYGAFHLNRTTVLTFWAEQQVAQHDPISFIFGNGIGSAHSATRGHVAKRYPSYGIGLTSASTLLWELGLFGFGLFTAIFAFAWRCAYWLQRESTVPEVRADAAAIQAALALFLFHLFYRSSLLELPSIQVVFSALLGYLAWLHRKHILVTANNKP